MNYHDAELVLLPVKLPHILLSDNAHNIIKWYFSTSNSGYASSIIILLASQNSFDLFFFLAHLIDSINVFSTF